MKIRFAGILLIFFGVAIVSGCQKKKESIDTSGNINPVVQKTITVFGSENCDHCVEFRHKADSLHIAYLFKDAEANEQYYNELLGKIQKANFQGYVAFPVIDIDGKIYVRPEFDEFLKLISE